MSRFAFQTRSLAAGTALIALTLQAGPSLAADNSGTNLLNPAPVETWQGFYAGISAGIGSFNGRAMDWDRDIFSTPDGDIDLKGFAGIFGAQAGYNYQHGGLVFGLEGDISGVGFDDDRTFDTNDEYVKAEMDWLATVRGRMGIANDRAMAYVTGGLALAGVEHCANDDTREPCATDDGGEIGWSGSRPGLVVGAGVEARLSDRWSFKSEYLYTVFADKNIIFDTRNDEDIDFGFDMHMVRVGLNYHLGGLPISGSAMPAGGPWQGLYAGISGGIGSFNSSAMDWGWDVFDNPDADINLRGFAGIFGAQAGYNHQLGGLVFGLEADISWVGFDEDRTFDDNDYYVKAKMDWLATVRGRMGIANDRAVAYVTGGLALAGVEHCGNDDVNAPCSIGINDDIAWSGTRSGLVLGAGVEARLSDRWSLKSEYLYAVFADKNFIYDTRRDEDIDFGFDVHMFRVGLNYHLAGLPMGGNATPAGGPWQGFYSGISGSIGSFNGRAMDWNNDIFDDPDGDIDLRGFAGVVGVQAGYNHQLGGLVFGLEGDISWVGFDEGRTFDDNDYYVKAKMDWLATLRGRMGVANDQAMAYVTGGLALAGVEHCANNNADAPCSTDNVDDIAWSGTRPGLVLGAGAEGRLSERWSMKAEYLYTVFADKNIIYDTRSADIDFGFDTHMFRVGLNYKFN